MNQEIVKYITEAREYGLSDKQIEQNLLSAGWKKDLVVGGFEFINLNKNSEGKEDKNLVFEKDKSLATEIPQLKTTRFGRIKKNFAWITSKYTIFLLFAVFVLGFSYVYYSKHGYWLDGIRLFSYRDVWQGFLSTEQGDVFSGEAILSINDENFIGLSNFPKKIVIRDDFNSQKLAGGGVVVAHSVSTQAENQPIKNIEYINLDNQISLNTEKLPGELKNNTSFSKTVWPSISKQYLPSSVAVPVDFLKPYLDNPRFVSKQDGQVTLLVNFNKNQLANKLDLMIEALLKENSDYSEIDLRLIKLLAREFLEKVEMSDVEMILDEANYKLYSMKVRLDSPSLSSFYSSAPTKLITDLRASDSSVVSKLEAVRDVKRIQDIKQIASALELYFNDNQAYPPSREGVPQDFFPKYLESLPIAPQATGDCSDFYNTYWYTNKEIMEGNKKVSSYDLSFCLGTDQQDLKAGIGNLSPKGITTSRECSDEARACFIDKKTDLEAENIVKGFVRSINQTMTIDYKVSYQDYDVTKILNLPEQTIENEGYVLDILKGLFKK